MARSESFEYSPYGSIPSGIEAVTLSDTVTYVGVQAFVSNEDGTLAVEMADGSSGSYYVKGGIVYPGLIVKFKSTGSSGITSISALY